MPLATKVTESKGATAIGRTRLWQRLGQTQARVQPGVPSSREEGPLLRSGASPTTKAPLPGLAPGWWLMSFMGQRELQGLALSQVCAILATSTARTWAVFKAGGRQVRQQITG